jgi:hypothetical protein
MDKFTVRDSSGAVDLVASAKAHSEALAAWVAQNETPADRISAAVNAVFDRFPGQRVPMPALVSLAVMELGATLSEHRSMSQRVHAFVQGAVDSGTLTVLRGKGGGVARDS